MTDASPSHDRTNPARKGMPAWVRMPLKGLAFAAVVFVVLYPYPRLFVRHIRHISRLDAMIEPNAPEFHRWDAELLHRLTDDARSGKLGDAKVLPPTGQADDAAISVDSYRRWLATLPPRWVQKEVESFVYQHVPYDWDWNVWGMADYMPTVSEMFARAGDWGDGLFREDCDGRAVIAASLMRRLGYASQIVVDLRHVWVVTPQGEWMSPGGPKAVISTKEGNKINWAALSNVPKALSFGVAVFPFARELIIGVALFGLLYHRRANPRLTALAALLMVQGLFFVRLGGAMLKPPTAEATWACVVGSGHVVAAVVLMMVLSRTGRRQAAGR